MLTLRFHSPLFALLLACGPASAFDHEMDSRRQDPPSELRESVRRVERETGGRVLRVEPVRRGGQETYRMKVLTPEGRVRVMQDNRRDDRRRPARSETPPRTQDD